MTLFGLLLRLAGVTKPPNPIPQPRVVYGDIAGISGALKRSRIDRWLAILEHQCRHDVFRAAQGPLLRWGNPFQDLDDSIVDTWIEEFEIPIANIPRGWDLEWEWEVRVRQPARISSFDPYESPTGETP